MRVISSERRRTGIPGPNTPAPIHVLQRFLCRRDWQHLLSSNRFRTEILVHSAPARAEIPWWLGRRTRRLGGRKALFPNDLAVLTIPRHTDSEIAAPLRLLAVQRLHGGLGLLGRCQIDKAVEVRSWQRCFAFVW